MNRTVDELLTSISSKELSEWMAYYSIEPFGEVRADMRAGSIVQATISPYIKKGHKAPSLQKCMLDFEVKEPMDTQDIKTFLRGLPTSTKAEG